MDWETIESITDDIVATLTHDDLVDAVALTFLLRRYRATGRSDVCDALEPALARALEYHSLDDTTSDRAAWLAAFSEGASLSDDERIHIAGDALADDLRRNWGHDTVVAAAASAIDACLAWSQVRNSGQLVAAAVDELERVVACAYRPEEGLAHVTTRGSDVRGHLTDHVALSASLLTAYFISARLPYSMLAEEVMQYARRSLWNEQDGAFVASTVDRDQPFAANCDAARVLCRLAALHADPEYVKAAVVAPHADYAHDAARVLSDKGQSDRNAGTSSAAYGLALAEWLEISLGRR